MSWRFLTNPSRLDLINSLNNTVSGCALLARGYQISPETDPSAKCIANAWIGQFSVQATDFNVLIISIIVCYSVFSRRQAIAPSTRATVLVCAAAWIPGLITSMYMFKTCYPQARGHEANRPMRQAILLLD